MKSLIYLHGFASSPSGVKGVFLREQCADLPEVDFYAVDFNPTPKDFEFMTVTGMIARLRQFVLDRDLQDLYLIGSSLGSLPALHYAARYGNVQRILLLSPALFYRPKHAVDWTKSEGGGAVAIFHYAFQRDLPLRAAIEEDGENYRAPVPPVCPVCIIHGTEDTVIPIEHSRQYAARYPDFVHLIEVQATHTLRDQLPLIWSLVVDFLLS